MTGREPVQGGREPGGSGGPGRNVGRHHQRVSTGQSGGHDTCSRAQVGGPARADSRANAAHSIDEEGRVGTHVDRVGAGAVPGHVGEQSTGSENRSPKPKSRAHGDSETAGGQAADHVVGNGGDQVVPVNGEAQRQPGQRPAAGRVVVAGGSDGVAQGGNGLGVALGDVIVPAAVRPCRTDPDRPGHEVAIVEERLPWGQHRSRRFRGHFRPTCLPLTPLRPPGLNPAAVASWAESDWPTPSTPYPTSP